MPEEEDKGAWWSDPAAAAEEGATRTPRRHRRNLLAKKNPQQATPTEDEAVVDVVDGYCGIGCPTRCQTIYTICPDEVNACLNDPTQTCYNMLQEIVKYCDCDSEIGCAGKYVDLTVCINSDSTTRVDNYFTCLVHHWDDPPFTCWESGTLCVPYFTCQNCCNSWEFVLFTGNCS